MVRDVWPETPGPPEGAFTTVMQWDSYPFREYDGLRYGMKSESFEPYAHLPEHVDATLELALGSPNAPSARLRAKGWRVRDPLEMTRTPWTYRDYIEASKGEFSVAKHGYVVSRSGWFSERSAAYLASGRPVVTQDTGFCDWLDSDGGVVAFSTPDEAREALRDVCRQYGEHCRKAREVAERYFDSDRVLSDLIERAMAPSSKVAR